MKTILAKILGRTVAGGAGMAMGAPLWLWVIGFLLVALAGVEGARRLQTSALRVAVAQEREGRAKDTADAATAALAQARTNAIETMRRLERQQEAQHVRDEEFAAVQRDAADARHSSDRLREWAAKHAAAAGGGTASDRAAASDGQAAKRSARMLAYVLQRLDERAGILAEYADRARVAGQQCERSYDALRARP